MICHQANHSGFYAYCVVECVGIEIARAVKADAMEFYKLEAKCFEMDGNDADTLYYWVPILSYQCCYKAVVDGSKIVGGIVAMPTFDKKWYINSLFVDPEYRRRGIANRLMQKVMDVAWFQDMILDVKTDRPHLIDFYNMWGFETVRHSVDHYSDDSDRFIMVRKPSRA